MKSLKNLSGDSLEQMIDYKVVDQNGDEIGTLHSLWSDPDTGTVEFLGVKTGWLFGHNHVVPAEKAELDEANSLVRLPYTESFIKDAPSMSAESEISEAEEKTIFRYYGTHSDTETGDTTEAPYVDTEAATVVGSSLGTSNVAEAAGSADLAQTAGSLGEAGSGGRLRRTMARPDATGGTTGDATTMSAASVSPDTTRDQLPTSAPAATYPTANLYGSTGNSTVPTGVATPGANQDTSTTGIAGRGPDTAGGTDPELSETAGGPNVGRIGKAEDGKI